jgi:hypothetical protein
MSGFAESYNLSVATAITLAHLSAATSHCTSLPANDSSAHDNLRATSLHIDTKGPLQPGDLPTHEYNCLFLLGLIKSIPQKRMAAAILRHSKITLPSAIKI